MNLQNPAALLWFVPLGALIVALYLLRMRRKDVQVPAVFLWPQRTEEVRANALIQKLRFSWLLVFQLLALLATVFAFARPQFKQKGLAGRVTVVVIDASASMGATDVKPSRFELARQSVSEMIGAAAPGDRLALIEAGPAPRVVFPLGDDAGKQRSGLESIQRYDAEADMGEALRLASAIAASTDGAKIVMLSDGVFDPVIDFSPGKAEVVYRPFGKSQENLGIQALGAVEGPEGLSAYCGVKNFGVNPTETGLSIYVDGKVIDSLKVTINPGQTWGKTFGLPVGTKVLEAKLDSGDALKSDDYAVALTDRSSAVRVLLVSNGDAFLERALALDPRVTLDKADRLPSAERATTKSDGSYDLIAFDGVAPEPTKARGVLTFGPTGNGTPARKLGEVKNPEFQSNGDDVLMKGVDFDGVYIEKMQKVEARGGGRIVAEAKEGPLVIVSSGKQRQVYVSFEPMESDFPLNVGFPILVGNALDFLVGRESADTIAVKVGQTFAVSANGNKEATLVGGGQSVKIQAHDDRFMVRQTTLVGEYQLKVGSKTRTVYASLRSPVESQIGPHTDLAIGSARINAVSQLSRFEDFWRAALILSLIILSYEWWFFARRS